MSIDKKEFMSEEDTKQQKALELAALERLLETIEQECVETEKKVIKLKEQIDLYYKLQDILRDKVNYKSILQRTIEIYREKFIDNTF